MKGRALLLVLLLLGSFPAFPANAGSTTHFGNSTSQVSILLDFNGPGHDSSTNISIGASSVITTAALDIRGLTNSIGERPESIGLDIGDDGDMDWFWGGPGNGTYGHLDEFSNGYKRAGLNMSTGNNSSYQIRLPINATINSASMQFSTLSELTISGSDVRDSYLHQPNPNMVTRLMQIATTAIKASPMLAKQSGQIGIFIEEYTGSIWAYYLERQF